MPSPATCRSTLFLLALAAGLTGCHRRNVDLSKYETVPITRGPLTAKVTASGTVSAIVTVTVGAQVSGRIEKLFADFNSPVKKGQLLAQIDPMLYEAQLESQKADVVSAKAQIATAIANWKLAQANYERDLPLFKLKLLDQADLDTARFTADADKAAIQNARGNLLTQEAQVRQAAANVYYTKIISPIDGTVEDRSVDVGQTVVSSYQAPALFIIAQDLRKMQVDTSVAESDIGKLQSGNPASFTVDAYPGLHFKGRIRQIRVNPQTVQNVVTYDVVIDVENPDLKLLPGMTADAEFVTNRRDDVLMVSNAAFRFHPPVEWLPPREHHHPHAPGHAEGRVGDGRFGDGRVGERDAHAPPHKSLWVLRDGQPVMVPVEVGITDGHVTEIVSGNVQEGDLIISAVNNDDSHAGSSHMRHIF